MAPVTLRVDVRAAWFQALVLVCGAAPLLLFALWTEQEWVVHRWTGYFLTAVGAVGLLCAAALVRFRRTSWDIVAAGALAVAALLSLVAGQVACGFVGFHDRPECW